MISVPIHRIPFSELIFVLEENGQARKKIVGKE